MRAVPTTRDWAEKVDEQVADFARDLAEDGWDLSQKAHLFVRQEEGGAGLGSAVRRQDAAFLAAWEAGAQR
eukprot:1915718-Lingulodinium_polyedra.AAC.1